MSGATQEPADPTAQAVDLPFDGHLHTDLSPDSDVPIDAYAAQAVERRIAEIAITDHVDFVPGTPAWDFTTFEERERTVREAAERWAPTGLTIRFGVEITYDAAHEADIRDHLARHAYDFVIGSVHAYADSPFHAGRVAAWTAGRSLPEIVAPYFEEVLAAIRSGLFDTIGHLDFVKRYLVPYVTPAQLAAAPELYEPLLAALVETGTALEVNTSGLRQAAARDLSRGADRGSLPGARRHRDLGRVRRAPERGVHLGAGGGVWCRGRRGVRPACRSSRRRDGTRSPPGTILAGRARGAPLSAHLTRQGPSSL